MELDDLGGARRIGKPGTIPNRLTILLGQFPLPGGNERKAGADVLDRAIFQGVTHARLRRGISDYRCKHLPHDPQYALLNGWCTHALYPLLLDTSFRTRWRSVGCLSP